MRTCTPDAPLQPVPSHPETPSFSQGQNSLLAACDLAQVGQREDGDRKRMSRSHQDGSGTWGIECVVWCEGAGHTPTILVHLPQGEGRPPAGRARGPHRSLSWSSFSTLPSFWARSPLTQPHPGLPHAFGTEESATTCRNQAPGPVPQVLGPQLLCEQLPTAAF